MDVLINVFVVLHLLGMAAIVGGWLAHRLGAAGAMTPLVWGARAQVVTGLLLVGFNEMGDKELNHAKIGVKLVVALAVAACAEIANAKAKRNEDNATLVNAAFGLTVVNVCVAVLWTSSS